LGGRRDDFGLHFGDGNLEFFLCSGWGFGFRRSGLGKQILIGKAGGTLEAASKFAETFRAGCFAAFFVNLFELRGKFRCAAVVSCTKNEVEKFFECRGVARRAAKNSFEKADGFLSKAVACEKVYVRERLSNELLRLFVYGLFVNGRRGRNSSGGSRRGFRCV